MIQINLLPEEMRRASRTSPKALGLLVVASVLAFGAVGTTGFLWFNVRADKRARMAITQEQLDNLTPRAQYADKLKKEKEEFEKRNKTIGEIAASRIVWSRKLDRLADVVGRDATQSRHRVWLDSLDVDAKSDQTPHLKLKGFSAGPDVEGVANFHDDLKADPVFREGFVDFGTPSTKQDDPDDGLEPPAKRSFDFELKLPGKDKKKTKAVHKTPAPSTDGAAK
jgi:Tfp pilus assembly protein PilN